FSAAHNLWTCYPDGRNPRAPHGNYPYPHHTFDGEWKDGRADRPWAEYCIKSIPGSHRYIAVAGKHHISGPWGTLVLIDTSIEDDNRMTQVTLFHNYELMDEAEDYHGAMDEGLPESPLYTDPWPLSEEYVIAVQGNKVYLLDKFGNQELLFSTSESACGGIDSIRSPIPLKARRIPPTLPTMTNQGERYGAPDHQRATIAVMDVYESDFQWPANTKISAIRVLQLFPYPWHSPWEDKPRVGPGNGANARAVLGVVPVEEDGSAYFEAPVEKVIYFQALDQNGMAVQSMRSATYVHPGEQLTCLGCHEKKGQAPARDTVPMALKRPPSRLVPNLEDGSCPLTYARLVEPLLENKCNQCHEKNNQPEPDLQKYQFFFHGTNRHSGLEPMHGGYRTIAGRFGAIATGLADIMLKKHHREALTMAEINRITLWADTNANELGAYRDQHMQRAGEIVWPLIDMDPENPAGLDLVQGRPAPPTPGASAPLMQKSEEFIKAQWPDLQAKRKIRKRRGK
ncbi:MAG: HzsA-related protein, partial [Planctomycetota bacterium]